MHYFIVAKVLRIFKALLGEHLKARFGTQFQPFTTIKKHGIAVLFVLRYQLGLLPWDPDIRNFSRKVSYEFSKAFVKTK